MTRTGILRRKVRLISFSAVTVIVLAIFAVSGNTSANRYRRDMEYTYLRALNELSDYVGNLEVTLTKGIYANTAPEQFGLSNKITAQCVAAKMALEQLPLNYQGVESINKFITQTGDFANYLSTVVSKGKAVSEGDIENLKQLGEYAKTINADIKDLILHFSYDEIDSNKIMDAYNNLSSASDSDIFSTKFKDMNESCASYPTLIYDGPFSDHITRMKSKFLENAPEVSKEDAEKNIVKFLGGEKSANLAFVTESSGNLPEYKFKTDYLEISVTKQGGYINYILGSHNVSEIRFNFNDASKIATEFMARNGINNMQESYYIINDGVCTINYSYSENGVVFYPDLIKIGVALDTGEIVSYNATGYLMNHTGRNLPKKLISFESAKSKLSKYLKADDSKMAVIPSAGLEEILCYEFECTGINDDKVLVYINAETGLEEQIYIMLDSDNGTLVM